MTEFFSYISDNIVPVIMAATPAITAIAAIIAGIIKISISLKNETKELMSKLDLTNDEIKVQSKSNEDLKVQISELYKENIRLKKTLNELLTKMDKVDRTNE